jgi:hypothetical protein
MSAASRAKRHTKPGLSPLFEPVRPIGGNAVMASRQAEQENEHDYFPTPPWAARAGGELIQLLDPRPGWGWEPACGEGHMAFGLQDYLERIHATDICDYGGDLQNGPPLDFLHPAGDQIDQADWIFSNPPFKLGEAFIRTAWRRARRGVAMLLRLQFIEGAGRHALFTRDCPLALSAPFCERVPMTTGRWDPDASSATAYAWFMFLKPEALAQSPLAGAIGGARAAGCHLERLIPPGTKARLQRREDLLRFGPLAVRWYREHGERLAIEVGEKARAQSIEYLAAARRISRQVAAARAPLLAAGGL